MLRGDTLKKIFSKLANSANVARQPRQYWFDTLTKDGWIAPSFAEDFLSSCNEAINFYDMGVKLTDVLAELDLPLRWVTRQENVSCSDAHFTQKLAVSDLGRLCIFLERVGFELDSSTLCKGIKLKRPEYDLVTDADFDTLRYEKDRDRWPPLYISNSDRSPKNMKSTKKVRTKRGYRICLALDADNKALWLESRAPKFRKKPEPRKVKCQECGFTYMKGIPGDGLQHRSNHQRWKAVQFPVPNNKLKSQAGHGENGIWVDASSALWKWKLVYERARAFKKEFNFDFTQWSELPQNDREAIAFLFCDDFGRPVGASGFRPSEPSDKWRMDWIWICPSHRRRGLLSSVWSQFHKRFGDFRLEPPLSEAMKAFVAKTSRVTTGD